MFYPIFIDKATLRVSGVGEVPPPETHIKTQLIEKKDHYEVWPIDAKGKEKNWYYSRKRVLENGSRELECKWVKGKLNPYFATSNKSEQKYQTVWTGSEYDAGAYGSTIVKNILQTEFPFPKSLYAVIDCIKAVIKTDSATILDFFAGSGTTGHAVSILNKDGGNRKFILCTNNENGIAQEVCYPRIKSVIKGHKDYPDITGIKSNLKYFKTSFVPAGLTDKNKIILTRKATEMLCVKEDTFDQLKGNSQYSIFHSKERYTGIIYDHLAIDGFKKDIAKIDGKFCVYVFSLGDDTFDEEFDDMKEKVKLSPIPEAILRVYRRIFR
jgi:adenine-specific DNA-methyltransferase